MYRETEDSITLHGLGFLQVKLSGNQRLHVWHPDLPRRQCFASSQIHDHRFGFVSRVMVGTQVNRIYSWRASTRERPASHMSYLHEGERTRFGNRPWIPDGGVVLRQESEQVIVASDAYAMSPYVYHSTHPGGDGRVATLMTKTVESAHSGAHSLCALGIRPDVDFDRKQWPEDELWRIVRDVLGGA